MDIGRLNKRLTFRTNSTSTDAGGGLTDSYSDTITVWGHIAPLRGYEKQVANGIDAALSHKAVIRYNANFDPQGQITYDQRTFRVHSVRDIEEAERFQEMMLTEVL